MYLVVPTALRIAMHKSLNARINKLFTVYENLPLSSHSLEILQPV